MRRHKNKLLPASLLSVVGLGLYLVCSGNVTQLFRQQETEQAEMTTAGTVSEPITTPLMAAPIPGEKILKREGYTVSYNTTEKQPNYVTWTLTPARTNGEAQRCKTFFQDPELTDDERSTLDDYRSSGYDRGHMCPAGDNKWSQTAMIESFYLSNICPQKHTLNGGDWRVLEEACRKWTCNRNENIHIVCGPIFSPDQRKRINKRVRIPSHFFKALLCTDKGKEKGIGFIFKNDTSDQPLEQQTCTIDHIEELTGYDLFATLNKTLQQKLESQSSLQDWE